MTAQIAAPGTAQLLGALADEVFASFGADPDDAATELDANWDVLRELDWPLVGIPEVLGGAGGEIGDVLALAEGVGRNAAVVPLLAALPALAAAAAGGRTELLSRRLVVETQPHMGTLDVTERDGGLTIAGTAGRVPWARCADTVLVRVTGGGRRRWIACDLVDPAITITAGHNLAGEPRDDVSFAGLVVPVEKAWDVPGDAITTRGTLLRCAATLGAMAAAVALTSSYVGEREQFGQPLRALPVVAHGVATMRAQLAAARAAVVALSRRPSVTNALATHIDVGVYAGRIARTAHDLHGAMGVAAEYPLHRFTKRLWAWPEEGVRQLDARAQLGRQSAASGTDGLWADLTA